MSLRVSNLALFLLVGIFLLSALKFFESPNEENFSMRVLFFGGLVVFLCYLLGSFFSPNLMKINQYGLFLLITSAILLEIALRAFPQLVPVGLLRNLSPSDREHLAKERGLATFNTRIGEGMVYHYSPFEVIKTREYIHIDSLGYRNPREGKKSFYDIVLLGDSMIFSGLTKQDLGMLYRNSGVSTLNLSMSGYAPQHYRDVYKKFVVDRDIKNTYTFVFFFMGNDFREAVRYERVRKKSGTWLAYADIPPKNHFQEALPWTVNITMGIPDYISAKLAHPQISVKLPYQTIKVGYIWPPPRITSSNSAFLPVKHALEEIITLSRANSSTPIIFLMPSPATLYSQFREDLKIWDESYEVTANTLLDFALQHQVKLFDLNGFFRKEISEQFIFAHEWDCHLNQIGIQKLLSHLKKIVPS